MAKIEKPAPPLSIGTHIVDVPCPRCGSLETILVRLSSVLTEGTGDDTTLKLRARSKAVDHMCGSRRLLDGAGVLTLSTIDEE
ncbi:hypothetical protein [Terrabacter terrigena]|uniref:Uncharacterized protein n=1 Tax=Terrabacter terrigena TaxID=574718 RepID=A0ABW3MWU3_9MICO